MLSSTIISRTLTLTLTYYQTNKDYERGTAMLEPYNTEDPKKIDALFIKEDSTWVLQQPSYFKISRIAEPDKILKQLNDYHVGNENLADSLKIKKSHYPNFDEYLYEESNGYILK